MMLHQLKKCQNWHHIETSQLICSPNQLTVFYMMATLAFIELTFTKILKTLITKIICGNRKKVFMKNNFK